MYIQKIRDRFIQTQPMKHGGKCTNVRLTQRFIYGKLIINSRHKKKDGI